MIRKIILAASLLVASNAFANYVGSEVQYFNPTPDNMDFFTVHSSRTLPKGTVKTTLFFDYAENIHYSSPALQNNVIQAQLGFGMGLTDRLSFSVAGSGILNYDDEVGGQYTTDDFTHVRTNLKYSFCNCSRGGWAIIASLGYGLMDPDLFVGDSNDFGAALMLAYDKMISDSVRLGVNLGYRYRNSEDTFASGATYSVGHSVAEPRDGSDVLASVGLNFAMSQKWTGVTELYMTLPTDEFFEFTTDNGKLRQKGAEVLLAANYNMGKMDIGFGGAVGVFDLAQNADWRAFVGMGFAFGGESEDAAFNLAGRGSAPAPVPAVAPAVETPVTPAPVAIEDAAVIKEFNITARFPTGSATLTNKAKAQLAAVGAFVTTNKNYRMLFVEGHTDSQGKDSFNKALSERRAQMVKNYIVRAYGVPADKIQSVGFGETAPVADNSTAAGRAQNRRVTIKVK